MRFCLNVPKSHVYRGLRNKCSCSIGIASRMLPFCRRNYVKISSNFSTNFLFSRSLLKIKKRKEEDDLSRRMYIKILGSFYYGWSIGSLHLHPDSPAVQLIANVADTTGRWLGAFCRLFLTTRKNTNSNKSTESKGAQNNSYNSAGIAGDVGGCQWTLSTLSIPISHFWGRCWKEKNNKKKRDRRPVLETLGSLLWVQIRITYISIQSVMADR